MKTYITTIIALATLFILPIVEAEDSTTARDPNENLAEVQKLKEEISRQEIILQALKERLSTLEPKKQEKELIINLIQGQPVFQVSFEELATALSQRAELNPGYPIIIISDKTTEYSVVVQILDLCRKAGLWNVAFAIKEI
jgi:biopolymer transport protein ExbD